ncbi:MAG: DUF3567 domain-containing protein [Burkholderiaceae bacterium]|nr:MAG: DUF3567 domain-containing protein [Burkholderiaceae bacterium]MBE7424934.1 DUF3567 domain-containing protein [Ideonella sp.]MCC7286375.1 DUF3567 domain-containing protein [Burkholderiaceae bacterium]
MHMLYNSQHYVVVAFELSADGNGGEPASPVRGGYEIVDKFARRGIFLDGAVAEGFKRGVNALVERGPSEEEVDDFIAGYTQLAQQPVVLH